MVKLIGSNIQLIQNNVAKKNVRGFTLIEMLIVMGILILLIALGIGGGRVALQNAADTATQSAIKQIYEAALAYKTSNGKFPISQTEVQSFESLVSGQLKTSLEGFDPGNNTVFYYATDSAGQSVLVCALLGGTSGERGAVCEGNGFGNSAIGMVITQKKIETKDAEFKVLLDTTDGRVIKGGWVDGTWEEMSDAFRSGKIQPVFQPPIKP